MMMRVIDETKKICKKQRTTVSYELILEDIWAIYRFYQKAREIKFFLGKIMNGETRLLGANNSVRNV